MLGATASRKTSNNSVFTPKRVVGHNKAESLSFNEIVVRKASLRGMEKI
jgi:hypothetical protein